MHEKKLPYIIKAELISSDEAKQVRYEAFNESKTLLKKMHTNLTNLTVTGKKSSPMNLNALKSIQNKVGALYEDTETSEADNLNIQKITKQIKIINNLFHQINDEELKTSLIEPETNALLTQFKIALISDANTIINNPDKALIDYKDFTFSGEYERLGKEFQAQFPRFLGYQVEIDSRFHGFSINLKGTPPTINLIIESPIEAIKPLIIEFLNWQLRKIGFTMMFDFTIIDQNKMICDIETIDSEDPLQTILDYQQEQVESSKIDTKNLKKFLIEQLKTEVDNDWKNNSYASAEFYPPAGKITIKFVGPWLWIKSQIIYGGVRWDPSTDRLRGDFESTERWYDWVGLAKSAPKNVSHPEELDKWAEIKTDYYIHNLLHEGREIIEITKDGNVKIRIDTFSYPDVESKYENIKLV